MTFYDTSSGALWVFLLLTVVLGGSGAGVTGSALASTWRTPWTIVGAAFLLACAVRFLHYALFAEPLLSLKNFAVDYAVMLAAAAYGYRRTRVRQMIEQYPWAYERAGFFWWRAKDGVPASPPQG
jgi:hypothetical protein